MRDTDGIHRRETQASSHWGFGAGICTNAETEHVQSWGLGFHWLFSFSFTTFIKIHHSLKYFNDQQNTIFTLGQRQYIFTSLNLCITLSTPTPNPTPFLKVMHPMRLIATST